eukprot:GHRR01031953.1.p1 GENE.GHRR01031953.1~~GHRR01031953.1.p1  ORF type:complete len:110 (+),score=15.78 GHRR01031953.1:777-1106(+)
MAAGPQTKMELLMSGGSWMDQHPFHTVQMARASLFGGIQTTTSGGVRPLTWDGYFQRGYGTSRCAPLPTACGNPGEPCCPSMIDQCISGMVHNRRFRFQPCSRTARHLL